MWRAMGAQGKADHCASEVEGRNGMMCQGCRRTAGPWPADMKSSGRGEIVRHDTRNVWISWVVKGRLCEKRPDVAGS